MTLQNSIVLITGGTSGIGLEFLKQLNQQSVAGIIITGWDSSRLEEVKRQFPNVHTVQSDVSNPRDIKQLYTEIPFQYKFFALAF